MIDLSSLTLADILPFVAVGFAAQLVDGALGMAFGVLSSTLLVALGMPPAQVSAAVHAVESFTTAASGTNHLIHRNIDWRLFGRLVIPGVIGGVAGAYLLTHVDASLARPFVLGYLGLLAIFLIWRGLRHRETSASPRYVAPLGLVGGFLDAAPAAAVGDRSSQATCSPRARHHALSSERSSLPSFSLPSPFRWLSWLTWVGPRSRWRQSAFCLGALSLPLWGQSWRSVRPRDFYLC